MTDVGVRVLPPTMMVAPAMVSRVLIADDEVALTRAYGNYLRTCGYVVEVVYDGRAAAERLAEHRFDVLVADIKMPHLDGISLLERVRAADPYIPVILTTASPSLEMALRARTTGAFQCLSKPFVLSELSTSVRLAIDGAKVARAQGGNTRRP